MRSFIRVTARCIAIGGRKVQSGLYRVTYAGPESTAPVASVASVASVNVKRQIRQKLEALHRHDSQAAVTAWPYLDYEDRFIRWAARTAVEHQPVVEWSERALSESDPGKKVEALMALSRAAGIDPFHRKTGDPPVDTPRAMILSRSTPSTGAS
jgi:hypothetical protein